MQIFTILIFLISLAMIGAGYAQDKAQEILRKNHLLNEHYQQEIDRLSPTIKAEHPSASIAPTKTKHQPTKQNLAWEQYQKGFNIWVKSKNYQQAQQYYRQALEIDPDFAPALSSYGFIRGAFYSEYDLAHQYLQKAQKIDPSWAYAFFNQGLLYSIQAVDSQDAAMHQKGINLVQYTVDTFPSHPDINHFKEHLGEMKRYHQERF